MKRARAWYLPSLSCWAQGGASDRQRTNPSFLRMTLTLGLPLRRSASDCNLYVMLSRRRSVCSAKGQILRSQDDTRFAIAEAPATAISPRPAGVSRRATRRFLIRHCETLCTGCFIRHQGWQRGVAVCLSRSKSHCKDLKQLLQNLKRQRTRENYWQIARRCAPRDE